MFLQVVSIHQYYVCSLFSPVILGYSSILYLNFLSRENSTIIQSVLSEFGQQIKIKEPPAKHLKNCHILRTLFRPSIITQPRTPSQLRFFWMTLMFGEKVRISRQGVEKVKVREWNFENPSALMAKIKEEGGISGSQCFTMLAFSCFLPLLPNFFSSPSPSSPSQKFFTALSSPP